jgi:hypothetical protein
MPSIQDAQVQSVWCYPFSDQRPRRRLRSSSSAACRPLTDMVDVSSSSSPTSFLRDRVRCGLDQLEIVYDAQLIEDTVTLAKEALTLSSESGADRIDA